eukprot:tig00000113_g5622.t1
MCLAVVLTAIALGAEGSVLEIESVVKRPSTLPGGIGGRGSGPGSAVYSHNGAWKLIVVGGANFAIDPWIFYNDIVIFDLSTNTWSSTGLNHNLGTGDTGATNSACAWDQESAVYCAGGINGFQGAVASPKGFKYLYGTNTLVSLPLLPIGRRGHCATFYAGKFWIFGGYTGVRESGPMVGSIVSLDTTTPGAQWQEETPHSATFARYIPSCARAGSRFYMHGGGYDTYGTGGPNTLLEVDLSPSAARPRPIRSLAEFGWTTGGTYGHLAGTCSGLFFTYQWDGSRPTKAYSFDPASGDTTARDVAIGGIDEMAPIVQFNFGGYGDDGNCRM